MPAIPLRDVRLTTTARLSIDSFQPAAMPPRMLLGALALCMLSACYRPAVLPQSEGHVTTPAARPSAGAAGW